MLQTLRANWKTTSAGLAMIIGSGVHMGFAIAQKKLDEQTLTNGLLLVVGGVGLIVAGDASSSVTKIDPPPNQVDNKKPTNTTP